MAFGATFCLYILQDFAKITPDTEAVLDLMVLVIGTILAALLIYLPQVSQLRTLQIRTRGLQRTLQELNLKQITGQEVSQEVLSLASQLTSVATQQAAGSQTQVATVTQVNSSVQELSTAASQITQIVHRVEKATNSMTEGSHLIESTTINSVEQAREGLQAVSQTLVASQRIKQLQTVAYQAQAQASSITKKAEEVENLTQIIHVSTARQSSASEQVLASLNELLEVARQGANGSVIVVNTARFLENLSDNLNKTLVLNQVSNSLSQPNAEI